MLSLKVKCQVCGKRVSYARICSHIWNKLSVIALSELRIFFDTWAGANECSVAVCVIHTSYSWPKLLFFNPW